MKTSIIIFLPFIIVLLFSCERGNSSNSESSDSSSVAEGALTAVSDADDKRIKISEEILNSLKQNDYEKVVSHFDNTLLLYLDSKKLEETWKSIISQVGDLESKIEVITTPVKKDGNQSIFIKCKFEKTPLFLKLVFDSSTDKVVGIFFLPNKDE